MNAAEIVELIAQQTAVSKKMADDFLKALIMTIEEALMSQDNVKIDGLGTFKLQWNEPRKSVDVNSGSEIIINGYHKVVFIPDAELKELANEPYAHLQPVLLDDSDTDQNIKEDLNKIPLKLFNEQANEIKDIISEINALNKTESEKSQEQSDIDIAENDEIESTKESNLVENLDTVEDIVPVEASQPAEVSVPVEASQPIKESVPVKEPSRVVNSNPIENNTKPIQSKPKRILNATDDFHPENTRRFSKTLKNNKLDFMFIAIMAGGLLVYILIDFNVFSALTEYLKSRRPFKQEVVQFQDNIFNTPEDLYTDSILSDSIITDSISLRTDSTMQQEPVIQEQVDKSLSIFDQPRVYNEFIATEKVISGSRLTRIAERHYGVKEFWVYIFEANRDLLNSPDDISPGMELKIPKLDPRLIDVDNPDCIEYALKLHDEYVSY